jgi:type IV secretion system protein VirB1
MRISRIIVAVLLIVARINCSAQTPTSNANTKLSVTAFEILARSCAENVPVSTLEAIARTESALHPYALSINRPHQLARRQGWNHGTITLERQPASLDEAIAWTKWLLAQGLTVSIGLLQVNSEHAALLHISPEQLFDPCTNLRAGAALLSATYAATARIHGEGFAALDSALSYYNTGSPTAGLANGYVQQVKTHAKSSETQR